MNVISLLAHDVARELAIEQTLRASWKQPSLRGDELVEFIVRETLARETRPEPSYLDDVEYDD